MIKPKNVREETLEQRLSRLPEGRVFFREIFNYVTACLFSRYPERRALALKDLNESLRHNVKGVENAEVHKLEEDGLIYAYLRVNNQKLYSLVAIYKSSDPCIEEVPSKEEKKRWKKCKS